MSTTAALLSGVAWQRLIVRLGYPCTFRTGLATYLSAGLGGYLMNSVGPVVGCAASLQAHGVSARRATLLTIIANMLGFCGVLVWAPIGLLVLSRSAGSRTLPILGSGGPVVGAVALLALATGMLLLLYALARASRTHNRLARLLLGPAPDEELRAASPLRCRHLLTLLPWTAASWIVGAWRAIRLPVRHAPRNSAGACRRDRIGGVGLDAGIPGLFRARRHRGQR